MEKMVFITWVGLGTSSQLQWGDTSEAVGVLDRSTIRRWGRLIGECDESNRSIPMSNISSVRILLVMPCWKVQSGLLSNRSHPDRNTFITCSFMLRKYNKYISKKLLWRSERDSCPSGNIEFCRAILNFAV